MDQSISIQRTAAPRPVPGEVAGFGTSFTDHMFVMDYHEGQGWHDPRIVPYGTFDISPATSILHYGQAIFDGLKAFWGDDGQIRLFRPETHAARVNRSAEALCIPPMDPDMVVQSFLRLVDVDRAWVPHARGTAIYLRPTIIANESFIGVRPAKSYLYFLILSPVGSLYAEGQAPVSLLATETYTRAAPGGLGAAKTPANYAASLMAAEHAKREGYTQVLWLDAVERRWLEEVGTMNLMVKIAGRVRTPQLSGTILAGVTRDSALTLMRDWGLDVAEAPISIEELISASRDGTLEEVWGTGTAAVISPVGMFGYRGEKHQVADGQPGKLTKRLYAAITDIQYGATPDPHGWTVPVPLMN